MPSNLINVAKRSQGTNTARSRLFTSDHKSSTVIGTRWTPCFSSQTVSPDASDSATFSSRITSYNVCYTKLLRPNCAARIVTGKCTLEVLGSIARELAQKVCDVEPQRRRLVAMRRGDLKIDAPLDQIVGASGRGPKPKNQCNRPCPHRPGLVVANTRNPPQRRPNLLHCTTKPRLV